MMQVILMVIFLKASSYVTQWYLYYFCKNTGPIGDMSNGQTGDFYSWTQSESPYCT